MEQRQLDLDFPPCTYEVWFEQAKKELKDKTFEDVLLWNSADGFQIEAYQTALKARTVPRTGPREWYITEPVYETDAKSANQHALHALNNGAEAVYFNKGFLGAAAEVACKDIDQQIARVFIPNQTVHDPYLPLLKAGNAPNFEHNKSVELNGNRLRKRGCSAVQEVAYIAAMVLEMVASSADTPAEVIIRTGVGSSLVTETSKIKSIRLLCSGILNKAGLSTKLTIVAENLCCFYTVNDEHTNIVRATSSALASCFGEADFIMLTPWDHHFRAPNSFSQRITRNVQLLMKHEARLDHYANPTSGSYTFEQCASAIAKNAWEKARSIDSAGGFTKHAESGKLMAEIAENRSAILKAYHTGDLCLLGVNAYEPADVVDEAEVKQSKYKLLPEVLSLALEIQKNP